MSLLCNPATCGTIALPTALSECLKPATSTGDCFIFLKCDYEFTDITDTVEWGAAILAGDVVVSPAGFWGADLPAQTTFSIGCGKTFTTQVGKQFVFESFLLDVAGLTEQDFYKTLRDGFEGYRVIPLTCDGRFFVSDAYVTGITSTTDSAGHEFSWIVPPDWVVTSGENQLFKWNFTLEIPTDGVLCSRYIPGLPELLKAQ